MLGNLFLTEENLQIDWNIALQVVHLSVQAVERTLEKTALLVLTKEELITWLASGKLIVQENQSYESYKIRIRSLLIVFLARTRSAILPLYISQRIALVVSCPYISKKKRWLGHSPSEWCRDSDSHRRTLSRRPVYQTLNSRSNNSRLVELRAAARTIEFRRQID